ncbi:leucine-rich repeat-containing protein 47-like [Toxorhynchites rutilus septentrionalis]|uniref:leucine-rich repeat-containing protein 47-like n=1 Tax=Toxorhynchites rutilus septentrionalis TaxID=329112 RepID=UPI00247979FD|nr:leucine-rich repeat-containing protein 47-like [Toxorhynchites rutilus septentrionalis]
MWPEVRTAKEENRRELKLSGPALRQRIDENGGKLDETIYQLSALNLLDINDTPLDEISPQVSELKNLQSLLLFRNHISAVPVELGQLPALKVLDLSGNRIESLPAEIGELKALTTVNLSGNKLKLVDLSRLENLIVCNLSSNLLEEFPKLPCGKEVQYLSEVNLEKNLIKEIPTSLVKQTSLKLLNVAGNRIELVPQFLVKCPKLKEILLKDNPLKDKRLKKLVEQCRSKQVLDYVEKSGHIVPMPEGNSTKSNREDSMSQGEEKSDPEIPDIRQRITVLKPAENGRQIISRADATSIRSFVVHCIVRDFTITSMRKFLQLQNELHDSECGRRELATIATHDLAKVKGNVRYLADLGENIQITPLGAKAKVTAAKYFDDLKKQAEAIRKEKKRSTYSGIHKYINLLEGKVFPHFSDEEKVISLPPLTNCDETKVSPETKDFLLEVTGSVSMDCCQRVMVALLKGMLLMDVETRRSISEGKKKAKGKGATVVTYDKQAEMLVEQVRQCDADGKTHSIFPGRGDLVFDEEEKIDIEFK